MASKKSTPQPPKGFLPRLDAFFEKHMGLFFVLSMALMAVLGFLLFELRPSEGEDDSFYIAGAKKFLEGTEWPGWHGPFYPIFLSGIMAIFGFNLSIFKLTSFLFLLGSLVFFYRTFRGRISSTLLVIAMLSTSVCSELLYFGSQTYTEAIYLFMQSVLFFMVIHYYLEMKDGYRLILKNWWIVLIVSGLLFLMSITRNIGIIALGVVLFYLLIEKKFYLAGYTLAGFLVFRMPFNLYKKLAWDVASSNMKGQLSEALLKNAYNPSMGSEDFGGMVHRFIENSEIYLSRLLMVASGLRGPDYSETSALVTILLYLLFAVAIYMAFRNHKAMKFTGLYIGLALAATFIVLQQHWGQMRLIIIYIPLIFLFIPWGLLELAEVRKIKWLQPVVVLLLFVMFFRLFGLTVNKAKEHNEVLMKNLGGNRYYGYTPDWVNFLRMSEWSAENVPEGSMIASRKPSMSFIYGNGRFFYPLYRFPTLPADTALTRLGGKQDNPVILNERVLRSRRMPPEIEFNMKRNVEVFMTAGDTMYSIYYFPEVARPGYLSVLQQYGLRYETDLNVLREKISNSGKPGVAVVPDTLINLLRRGNVDYMIRGSLRLNPAQKTDRVINTVHRYMYYMEQKYIGIFSQVSQMGNPEDEPAYLFKINWERYGFD
jgi:hypothetical protein